MRQNGRGNTLKEKKIAALHYRNRKIDQYIKWSIRQKGYLKYKDLVAIQDEYGIKTETQSFIKQLPKGFL
jgi:hypothetical protein